MLSRIAQSIAKNTVKSCRVLAPKVPVYQFSSNALSEKVNNLKRIMAD